MSDLDPLASEKGGSEAPILTLFFFFVGSVVVKQAEDATLIGPDIPDNEDGERLVALIYDAISNGAKIQRSIHA